MIGCPNVALQGVLAACGCGAPSDQAALCSGTRAASDFWRVPFNAFFGKATGYLREVVGSFPTVHDPNPGMRLAFARVDMDNHRTFGNCKCRARLSGVHYAVRIRLEVDSVMWDIFGLAAC